MKPTIGQHVRVISANGTRGDMFGVISGPPTTDGDHPELWPIKLDDGFYSEDKLTFVRVTLVHPENLELSSKPTLTPHQRTLRSNIRSFLLTATTAELAKEFALSVERGDQFRAVCIQELINEA